MGPTPEDSQSSQPHVLIIGGGIGGLCLAQGLKKHGISFTVFERDPSPTYRTQGYRLRISDEGYTALETNLTASVLELYNKSTAEFRPGFSFLDPVTAEALKPEHGLSEQELRFGMAFKEYSILPDGRVQVTFENGQTATGIVLVGVDGAHSRVRKQYIPEHTQLLDTDGRAIYGKTMLTPEIEAMLPSALTSNTTMITSEDPHMSLFLEPVRFHQGNPKDLADHLPDSKDYIYWVLTGRSGIFRATNEAHTDSELFALGPEEVAALSLKVTSTWHPSIRALLEYQERTMVSFISYTTMSPNITQWEPSQITLMGDAIHAMTPAGRGANTALKDAGVLLECFREHGVGIDAIGAYEAKMRVYGTEAIVGCVGTGKKMYGQPDFEAMEPLQ
uniref:FAD-binding domain-containing protein n=1 Tax=Globisporangium ultimum (strain ATCC 200006 / CBS 805.95 / DAOM BR144) TaxID=431595 RepID=K3WTH6_GLOUD